MLNEIKKIIAEVCQVPVDNIRDDSAIGDFPTWDSIGHLTILSRTEEKFNLNFEPEEMMDIESVDDIVRVVEGKLQG